MKIAHFSDCHVSCRLRPGLLPSLLSKRMTGLINLYTRRRYQLFNSEKNLYKVMKDIKARKPDFIVFSGDVTAISLKDEFSRAREIIYNFIEPDRLFLIPGNHDIYTYLTSKNDLFHQIFTSKNEFINFPYPKIRFFDENILFISLNSARFNPLFFDASGYVKKNEIDKAEAFLNSIDQDKIAVKILIIHHSIYKPGKKTDSYLHGLRNFRTVIEFIKRNNIHFLFSGHIHKQYIVEDRENNFTQYNPGSTAKEGHSGYFIYDLNRDNSLEYRYIQIR